MSAGVRAEITAAVFVVLACLWWVFDTAPGGSRRSRLANVVARWGNRGVRRGWRRPSFLIWTALSAIVVLVLISSGVH